MNAIVIFYVSIGSGHQVAAEAVGDTLRQRAPACPVTVIDPFSSHMAYLPQILSFLQAMTIRFLPRVYHSAWRGGFGGRVMRPLLSLPLFRRLLTAYLPPGSTVVCTHGLPMVIATDLRRRGYISRLYGIITDYGAHAFWPVDQIDGYFVAHEALGDELARRGVASERICVSGIPLRASFLRRPRLLLSSTTVLRLLIIAGGLRQGAYDRNTRTLLEALALLTPSDADRVAITFVAGKHERLRTTIAHLAAERGLTIDVNGYVPDIERLLFTTDVVVSKPGGLIVSEILACGRGLIALAAGPGQETANRQYLLDNDVALNGETPARLVAAIRRCIADRRWVGDAQARAAALGRLNATETITDVIMMH